MGKDQMDKYLAANHSIYVGTVGPKQAIVLPFDCLFCERTGKKADLSGVRVSFYLKADEEEHLAINRWLIGASAPSSLLQLAVDEGAD